MSRGRTSREKLLMLPWRDGFVFVWWCVSNASIVHRGVFLGFPIIVGLLPLHAVQNVLHNQFRF